MDRTVGGVLSTSGGVTSGGAMLFATGVAAKLAREFGGDAASSMLPVVLVYARLMTSSSSSEPLRERVTILSLAAIALTVGVVVISPVNSKSPGAAEFTVMSSDSTRSIVVGLAVPMDRTVGGVLSTSGGVTSGGAMLFVTGVAAKLAREFDAASSMLPVVLAYARLMTSSSSSEPLRVRVTVAPLAVIVVTVGVVVMSPVNSKSPGAAEFTVISSDSTRSIVVGLAVPMDTTVGGVLSTSGGVTSGGAMLFVTEIAAKLAREFDAASSMLPVVLAYARLMTSSSSSVPLRVSVTILSLAVIVVTVGVVVISPDSTKSPGSAEFTVMSSDSTRSIVVGLAVPMDRTVGGVPSTTGVAAKLAREFGCGDAASSMLPVFLEYARLISSSSSSIPLRERVTVSPSAAIALTVGLVVISPDNTKSPGAVELSVISSDSMRLMVVVLAVSMDRTVGGALSTVPVNV